MNKIIFPGSFDPFTNGHLELLIRASKIYDEVLVVVVSGEKNTMFSSEQRKLFIECSVKENNLKNVNVMQHKGMIVDFCKENDIYLILRGLRNITDLSFEHNMSIHNKLLDDRIETICLLTKNEFFHVSSSAVRELLNFNKDINHLVPKCVASEIGALNENI